MPMKNPPHPGAVVWQECIEPLALSITEAAAALGVTRNTLSELVNEKRGISPEMAVRLEKAFGGAADTWLRVQANYDLAQVRSKYLPFIMVPYGLFPSQFACDPFNSSPQ